MRSEFWRARSVFVTGHTGFKGSWLCLWLQALGARVSGYALTAPTEPSLFELAGVARGMVSLAGDVRDGARLARALEAAQPEVVLHLAAQPLVRRSYEDPVETYATNVMGTVNLLEAVRHCASVRSVVNVTTDKCYENREQLWPYRENEAMGGYDPYSSSKGCSELVTAAYRRSFFESVQATERGVALASARAGNVIGGGDWARDRLVPDLLAAFAQDRPAAIRNPQAVRPWQHVLEPLQGYLTLAEALHGEGARFAQAYNFGPRAEDARSVSAVADELASLWGGGARWAPDTGDHPHEAGLLQLDTSKARHDLNWAPRLTLTEALALTVRWYKGYARGEDVRSLTVAQIEDYAALGARATVCAGTVMDVVQDHDG